MIQNITKASGKTSNLLAWIITIAAASYMIGEPGNWVAVMWQSKAIAYIHNHLLLPAFAVKYVLPVAEGLVTLIAFVTSGALLWITIRYGGQVLLWGGLELVALIENAPKPANGNEAPHHDQVRHATG